MATTPSVFIVDQDPDARFQAGRVVQEVEFSLGGEAGAGTEAVALASDSRPDILLVGIKEPLTRAVQTIESLVYALPHTPVIAYAETDDLETIRRAMLAGARDFLRAPFKTGELKRSLIAALESEERRRLREAGEATIGPRAVSIAVFGAKGGIGKTTVAANLGVALARAGQSTVLVDLDDTFGDAAASLDLSPEQTVADALRAAESEADGVAGERALEAAVHDASGLRVIAAPASPLEWTDVRGERVGRLLHQLASKVDVLIADTASSLSERTLAILEASSVVLWVTTPDYPSVRDSLQAMQALTSLGLIPEERVRLVLNVSSPDLEVRPASVEEALGMSIFWTLPYESRLRRSGQLGQAFVVSSPSSAWSMSVTELGRILTGGQQTAPSQARSVRGWLGGLKIGSWKRNTLEVRGEVRP